MFPAMQEITQSTSALGLTPTFATAKRLNGGQ
jgi:hypothetical protein